MPAQGRLSGYSLPGYGYLAGGPKNFFLPKVTGFRGPRKQAAENGV